MTCTLRARDRAILFSSLPLWSASLSLASGVHRHRNPSWLPHSLGNPLTHILARFAKTTIGAVRTPRQKEKAPTSEVHQPVAHRDDKLEVHSCASRVFFKHLCPYFFSNFFYQVTKFPI